MCAFGVAAFALVAPCLLFWCGAKFVLRFQNDERRGCQIATRECKVIAGWCFVFEILTVSMFFGARLIGKPQSLLYMLREFFEAWALVWMLLALIAGLCLLVFLIIPIRALWMDFRELGSGGTYLASVPAFSISETGEKTSPTLMFPAINANRILHTCVYTLLLVFAGLWIRTNVVSYFGVAGMVEEAGYYLAESDINNGKVEYRELAEKSLIFPPKESFTNTNVEYWNTEFGFGNYMWQSAFVKGYNLRIKIFEGKNL